MINCRIIEGQYADIDKIKDDFVQDYIFSSELSNKEIRAKYGLTWKEFSELCESVKLEYGFSRRPKHGEKGRYYYKTKHGYIIAKRINNQNQYLGFVPTEEIAKKCVELCSKLCWEVEICKDMIKNWREHCA